MRYRYQTVGSQQDVSDSMPRLPLTLRANTTRVETVGLVDSGATVNVMPYALGIQLGAVWNDRDAIIPLSGNLGKQPAMPLSAIVEIDQIEPVKLVFAWTRATNIPLILGQTNFFIEFDICFYRSKLEFEINRRSL